MAAALAPPPSAAGEPSNGQNIGVATDENIPSNISVVSTSKEDGLEKAAGAPDVKEFDYPDGGLRGEQEVA